MFGYENKLVFPVYISDQVFKSSIDSLLLINDDQSHYVYFLTHLCYVKQKIKIKSGFAKIVYSVLVVKMFW